jgi:biotin transport system substrate-specific component
VPAPRDRSPAADLATVVVFAAFIAVLGIFPGLYVGGSGVPVVLQNIGPLLAGAVLGARRGTAAVLLLLVLTAFGLPLLSGGRGGLAPFVGPSGGFLLGWILSALVTGLIAGLVGRRARVPRVPVLLLATAAGLVADYAIGIPWLGLYSGDLGTAVVGSLVFVPGDAAKVVVAALVAAAVHRALPDRLAPHPR